MNVGENNRQPTRLLSVNATWFIKYCLPCRFFLLLLLFSNVPVSKSVIWNSNNNSRYIVTFRLVGYFFPKLLPAIFRRPNNQLSLYSETISTLRSTKELKFEEIDLSWKSLLICKYLWEISSNSMWTASKNPSYIFYKMKNSLFSFRRDKPKPKQLRLPFSREFLSNLIRHISHSPKKVLW